MSKINKNNVLHYIMDYESGQISDEDFINLFQYLVDSGLAWRLQGSYGRLAKTLIESGLIEYKR